MAVHSTMLPLGSEAPPFKLPDTDGRVHDLIDTEGAPGVLVMFLCNHCPYVQHIADMLAEVTNDFIGRGLAVFGINSNDTRAYPDDAPDAMAREIELRGFRFPYLVDEDQSVAHAYRAACTPDFFLFDSAHKLVYRGQFDDSRPKNDLSVTGRDLKAAVDALLTGESISDDQRPSMGCNIKWKPGNEPDYFG